MVIPMEIFLIFLVIACAIIGIGVYYYILATYHTKPIPNQSIHEESFKIPIETETGVIELEAKIIKSDYTPKNLAPCVIMCHGWRSNIDGSKYLQWPLTLYGYALVTYSSRGHGKSGGKRDFPQIYEDVIKVIDFLQKNNQNFGIDTNRLAVIGHSMGASISLMKAYLDARVKMVVGISGLHDFKDAFDKKGITTSIFWVKLLLRGSGLNFNVTADFNQLISPKYYLQRPSKAQVFLIHAKDDRLVEFHNFEKNVALLHLPADHTLVFERGGHSLYRLECMIVAQIIKWLNQTESLRLDKESP
ncbi:MAG: alpha/beta fold hydrolase [Candidatus Helarchaeota archaeon]|nr:alpha/beta fold hydrolase [Candidatus Helarchaeota archaeon]